MGHPEVDIIPAGAVFLRLDFLPSVKSLVELAQMLDLGFCLVRAAPAPCNTVACAGANMPDDVLHREAAAMGEICQPVAAVISRNVLPAA
jgi:hypothetical protein